AEVGAPAIAAERGDAPILDPEAALPRGGAETVDDASVRDCEIEHGMEILQRRTLCSIARGVKAGGARRRGSDHAARPELGEGVASEPQARAVDLLVGRRPLRRRT